MTPRNRSETPIRLTVQGSSRAVCSVTPFGDTVRRLAELGFVRRRLGGLDRVRDSPRSQTLESTTNTAKGDVGNERQGSTRGSNPQSPAKGVRGSTGTQTPAPSTKKDGK